MKDFAADKLSFFDSIPSYQKVIAREGISGDSELAAVGSAESVRHQLQRYLDAGVTDLVLSGLAWTDLAAAEELWALAASI
jgi:alkanesulfonate monooxygenase SsuD/methylene tetrahydromethanopterin reductase-like flavin-dependent oxidoreductase (luciferase family)